MIVFDFSVEIANLHWSKWTKAILYRLGARLLQPALEVSRAYVDSQIKQICRFKACV